MTIFLPISFNLCFCAQKNCLLETVSQKNRLLETILLSTNNIMFRLRYKIINFSFFTNLLNIGRDKQNSWSKNFEIFPISFDICFGAQKHSLCMLGHPGEPHV